MTSDPAPCPICGKNPCTCTRVARELLERVDSLENAVVHLTKAVAEGGRHSHGPVTPEMDRQARDWNTSVVAAVVALRKAFVRHGVLS